jgi:hypothetical protein
VTTKKIKGTVLLTVLILLGAAATAVNADPLFYAGAAKADITPVVSEYEDLNGNGMFDLGDPAQAFGFGDRVIAFEEGPILIGNGEGEARYVYDPLGVQALVVKDAGTGVQVALVAADLYLITHADIEAIRTMVDPELGIDYIAIAATHNHMGPDTLGLSALGKLSIPELVNIVLDTGKAPSGINSIWFEKFRRATVDCIEKAARTARPARITVATDHFTFGQVDSREPLIANPDLNAMAVDGLDGKPIATLLNWSSHPEAVLNYGRCNIENPQMSCDQLTERMKDGFGRTLSAGFPGYARAKMDELRGGVSLYFNGTLGGMMTNLSAPLWDPEAHPKYPADTPPENVPQEIRVDNDFRFAPIQGREIAKAALKALVKSTPASVGGVSTHSKTVLIPLENHVFRVAGSIGVIGYEKDVLYDDDGNPDRRIGSWVGGIFMPGVPVGKGKNFKTEVSLVNIGPAQIVNVPAEIVAESILGLPDDFMTSTEKYYPTAEQYHAVGDDYKLAAPPLKELATGEVLFVFGLSGGEHGYAIPKSDFNPPHGIRIPPISNWWISVDAINDPHYEESMSASSQLEPLLIKALADLLRTHSAAAQPASKDASAGQ